MATGDPRFLAAVPALPVADETRSASFWQDAFGFERGFYEGKPVGILRRDSVEIHLWEPDGIRPGAERQLIGSVSCRIEVSRVDSLYERCADLGVLHPNAPLIETVWGTREFGVLDPDGNFIGVFERVREHGQTSAIVAAARVSSPTDHRR